MLLSVTALLLKEGKQFARHSAVKSEFTRSYIKSGKIDVEWSKFYQNLFDQRQEADYIATIAFDEAEISERIKQAEQFIVLIRSLIDSG